MRMTLEFYKKQDRWFNDDPDNGYDEGDNEMVAGVPELIESFVGTEATRAAIEIDSEPFSGATALELVNGDVSGGVEYRADIGLGNGNPVIWLCKVFWVYFDQAPRRLYFKARRA